MKTPFLLLAALAGSLVHALAGVTIDADVFAKSLGGWKKANTYADYALSGADYRTYKPEISPTPDGGVFVSIRIDHVRGWLSSNDHAGLEITLDSKGVIVSAQSTIAIQGQSIASDVIVGTGEAGKELIGADRAVQIGTDLVSNLSAKLLRENIVEAGRVSFPAVLRHNYNRLFQSIRVEATPVAAIVPGDPAVTPAPLAMAPITPATPAAPVTPPSPPEPAPVAAPKSAPTEPEKPKAPDKPADPVPGVKPLEIKPYGTPAANLPVKG